MKDQTNAYDVASLESDPGSESHYLTCNRDKYENGYGTGIGIDTIGLIASDFRVAETAELQVQESSNSVTGQTGNRPLYRLGGDGQVVVGTRSYANLEATSVTIYAPEALYIEVTLPRVLRPNNRVPVGTSFRLRMSLKVVQKRLQQFGITTELLRADITRLDISRNVHTTGPLPDYHPVLSRCSFPQTEVRKYEDGGHHWTNGSRQVLIYAKGKKEDSNPLVQRLEYRLTEKRSVEAQIGTKSLRGLLEDFDAVRQAYRSAADDLLPDLLDVEEASPTSPRAGLLAMIDAAKKQANNAHSRTLQALGLRFLQERGAEQDFLRALEEDSGRMAVSRYRRTFDELAPIADLLSEEERSGTDMLRELRTKLLA